MNIATPPVDTTQSFAVVLNYALLPGASAGNPLLFGDDMVGTPPTGSSGRTVLRFDAGALDFSYQHSGDSLEASFGIYDPLTLANVKLGTDSTTYANATFSGIDWYQGLATDDQMQALSDGAVIGSERGMIRKPINKIIKPLIHGVN